MAKKRPSQRQIDETDQRLPLACLKAIGHAQLHLGIHIRNDRPANRMGLALRGAGQINSQLASER